MSVRSRVSGARRALGWKLQAKIAHNSSGYTSFHSSGFVPKARRALPTAHRIPKAGWGATTQRAIISFRRGASSLGAARRSAAASHGTSTEEKRARMAFDQAPKDGFHPACFSF